MTSAPRRVYSRSSVVVSGGVLVAAGGSLLANVLVPNILPTAEAGSYFTAASFVAIASVILRFGLDRAAVRLLASSDATSTSPVARRVLVVGVSVFIVTWSISLPLWHLYFGAMFHMADIDGGAFFVATWLAGETARSIFSEALRGIGRISAATWLGDAGRALLLLAGLALLWERPTPSIRDVVTAAAVASATISVVAVVRLFAASRGARTQGAPQGTRQEALNRSRRVLLGVVWAGAPFLVTTVWGLVSNQGDILVASSTLTPASVAVYAAASKLSQILALPTVASAIVISPVVPMLWRTRSRQELERYVQGVTAQFGVVVIPASVLVLALSRWIFQVVYPSSYGGAASIFVVLCLGPISTALTGPNAFTLLMANEGRVVAGVTSAIGVLQAAGMVAASVSFGTMGLAVASSAGTVALNFSLALTLRRKLGIRIDLFAVLFRGRWPTRRLADAVSRRKTRRSMRGSRTASSVVYVGAILLMLLALAIHAEQPVMLVIAVPPLLLYAVLPFRLTSSLLVIGTSVTGVSFVVAGFNARPDMILCVGALASAFVHGEIRGVAKAWRFKTVRWLTAYVCFNFAASVTFSPDLRKSLAVSVWLALDLLTLAVGIAAFTDNRPMLKRLLYIGAAVNLAVALLAFGAAIGAGSRWGVASAGEGDIRARGLSYEPNILACLCALWIIILITGRMTRTVKTYGFVIAAALGIVLSQTRAAVIAIVLAVLVASISRASVSRRVVGALYSAAVALLIYALLGGGGGIFGKFGSLGGQTSSLRLGYWAQAIGDMHGWAWIFGLGTNTFGMRHFDPTSIYLPQPLPAYLGNLPLQAFYETGILGFMCLLLAGVSLISEGGIAKGRAAALVAGFTLMAIGTSPFYFAYFWLCIGCGLIEERRDESAVPGRHAEQVLGHTDGASATPVRVVVS